MFVLIFSYYDYREPAPDDLWLRSRHANETKERRASVAEISRGIQVLGRSNCSTQNGCAFHGFVGLSVRLPHRTCNTGNRAHVRYEMIVLICCGNAANAQCVPRLGY